ncbi:MAG: type II toxin-antitoxin system VapC family toxin [Bythopirellula sp.]|nr:type II toxin-antitoxin system VapC family toxin [Bythopirellula sp.]
MIVLDTNVISALMQSTPERRVVTWLNKQPSESIWTTSVNLFEILYGLHSMTKGKRREALQVAFEQAMEVDFEGRILDFDAVAAREAAMISAKLRAAGSPVEIRDVEIAGIVKARNGTLATRNTRHFGEAGIKLIDPWGD